MENPAFDRLISIVFVIIGAFLVNESTKITSSAYGSNIGPGTFPLILGVLLVLLSLFLLIKTFKYEKRDGQKQELDYKKFFIILVSIILYAILLEPLGYVITTFLLLVTGFQLLEKGKLHYSIIIAALFSGIVYYVYVKILKGTLPPFPEWLFS